MYSTFFKYTLFIFLGIFVLSCTAPKPMDDVSHYTPYQKLQQTNLIKAHALFDKMGSVDVALFLSEDDFAGLINQSFVRFKKHFSSLDAPSFSKVHFGEMQIELGVQSIRSRIDFSLEVDALQGKLYGYLLTDHEIKAVKDAYRLETHFHKIVLSRMENQGELDEADHGKLIAHAVESFLHTLNVEIINMPLGFDVDMNVLADVNGKDIAYSKHYSLHSARPVNMQTKMEMIMPYISPRGVVLIGAGTLKDDSAQSPAMEEISALHCALSNKLSLVFEQRFGVTLDTMQHFSAYYMSKDYLARQMNFALDDMDLRLIHKFFLSSDQYEGNISREITFFDKLRLPECEGVKEDCSLKKHSCDLYCEQQFGPQSCGQCSNVSNPFEQVRCMSELEKCKSKHSLRLYECHKREDRCSLDNEELVNVCEVLNLDAVNACNEKKEALDFVNDSFTLAELNLAYRVPNSYIVQRISQIRFDNALRSLEVKRNMHVSVDSALMLKVNPAEHEDFQCQFGLQKEFLTHSQVDYVNEIRTMPLYAYNTTEGGLVLKAIAKPGFKSVNLTNPPFNDLLADPNFKLTCQYQGMDIPPISGDALLEKKDVPAELSVLFGSIELDLDEEELSFPISPARIEAFAFYPTMQKQAVVFSRKARF